MPKQNLSHICPISFPEVAILLVSTKDPLSVPLDKGNEGSGDEIDICLKYEERFNTLPLTTSVNSKQQGIPFVVVVDDDDDDDDDDDGVIFRRREATAGNTSAFPGYFYCY